MGGINTLGRMKQSFDIVRHAIQGFLEWKLLSCSHCQELGQLADLAPDWLFMLVQPIRSQFAC